MTEPEAQPEGGELLPCPFCASHAHVRQSCIPEGSRLVAYWIECVICEVGTKYHDNEADAITVWNTRADLPRATAVGDDTESDELVNCPDCVEGKITAGCAIDKPLISVDCGRCKGTGRIKLPTINLPFSMDDIRRNASTPRTTEAALAELRAMFPLKVRGNKQGRGIDVERNDFATSSLRGDRLHSKVRIRIEYATGGYSAPLIVDADSLDEAMAQVRAATRTEGEGEKS